MKRNGWFNEEGAKKYKEMLSRNEEALEENPEEELENTEDEIERIELEMADIRDDINELNENINERSKKIREILENLVDLDEKEDEDTIHHYEQQLEDLRRERDEYEEERLGKKEELYELAEERSWKESIKSDLKEKIKNTKRLEEEDTDNIKEELECLELVKRIDAICEENGNLLVSESFKASRMYHYIFHHEYIYTGEEARDLIGDGWRNAIAGRMRIFPVRAEEVEQFPDGSIRCAPYVFQKENIFGDFDGSEKGFIHSFQNPE